MHFQAAKGTTMARKSPISILDVLPAIGFVALVAYAVTPTVCRSATYLMALLR
jgi:hypothetical protein